MSKTLQFRRGTTSELAQITGAEGELFVDTTKDTVVVMDGSTAGGFPLQGELVSGTTIKTINGQSILGSGDIAITGGSSFDQSLNTTDDVAFNSSLIGDVSIIGNTIGGTDAYGNIATLIIDGDLQVTKQISNTSPTLTANWTAPANLGTDSFISTYAPGDPNCYIHTYNTTRDYMDWMLARTYGDVVNLELTINSIVYTGTVTLGSVIDQANALAFYITSATGDLLNVFNGTNSSTSGVVRIYKVETVTTVSTFNPLSVTEAGVNVDGTFTVNGAPISSGSSDLTLNQDGSKSILIDTSSTSTTNYTYGYGGTSTEWAFGSAHHLGTMSSDGKKLLLTTWMGPMPSGFLDQFLPGDTLTFKLDAGGGDVGNDYTVTLTSGFAYDVNQNGYIASIAESNIGMMDITLISNSNANPVVVQTRSVGSINTYTFGTDGIFNTLELVTDAALIGNVSIIGNTIGSSDSYGNAGTLNVLATDVVFDAGFNIGVNSLVETTETVNATMADNFQVTSGNPGTPYFKYSGQSDWSDASKFVTGSVVTTSSMGNTAVIQLTSDMTYDMMNGWRATYTVISGSVDTGSMPMGFVIVTNSSGAVANYAFDDQGTLTAPTVSTNELLINGSVPGFLTVNQDGSKSIVVDTSVETNYTVTDPTNMSQFIVRPDLGLFTYAPMPGSGWADASKFVTGSIVTVADSNDGTAVIELTSDMTYNSMDMRWEAMCTLITNPSPGMIYNAYSVSVTTLSGSIASYDFTEAGFIAPSALIGDVSIVGNTIAALDSYGNGAKLNVSASDLVFDSGFNLAVNSLVETSETISDPMHQFRIDQMPNSFTYNGILSAENAAKLKTGAIVTLVDSMGGGTAVIQLTSDIVNMAGWAASYTFITNPSSAGYNYRANSITVGSSSGTIVNYSFDDQGTFTAPTVSTNKLLVDGAEAGLLTTNVDGSKSVVVPKIITTIYSGLYWNMGSTLPGNMDANVGKLEIDNPNQAAINLFSSLKSGDKVTFTATNGYSGPTIQLTVTVQTAGFNYDMMTQKYLLDVVEINPNMDRIYLDFSHDVYVQTSGLSEYTFDGNGFIADAALIGDVSIIDNTIFAVDSYGNPSELNINAEALMVNGSLMVNGVPVAAYNQSLNTTDNAEFKTLNLHYHNEHPVTNNYTGAWDNGYNKVLILYPHDYMVGSQTLYNSDLGWYETDPVLRYAFPGTFIDVQFMWNGVSYTIHSKVDYTNASQSNTTPIEYVKNGNGIDVHFDISSSTYVGDDGSSGAAYDLLNSVNTGNWDWPWSPYFYMHLSSTVDSVIVNDGYSLIADNYGVVSIPNLVSDAALIGDVSIIGDTISNVDSYGHHKTIKIDSNVDFIKNELQDVLYPSYASGSAYLTMYPWEKYLQLRYSDWNNTGFNYKPLKNLTKNLVVGDKLRFTFMLNGTEYKVYGVISQINTSGVEKVFIFSSIHNDTTGVDISADIGNLYYSGWTDDNTKLAVINNEIAEVSILEIGNNGITNLSTENATIANSATIGNVSIANNSIRALDAAGKPTTLNVETDFNVIHTDYLYHNPGITGWSGNDENAVVFIDWFSQYERLIRFLDNVQPQTGELEELLSPLVVGSPFRYTVSLPDTSGSMVQIDPVEFVVSGKVLQTMQSSGNGQSIVIGSTTTTINNRFKGPYTLDDFSGLSLYYDEWRPQPSMYFLFDMWSSKNAIMGAELRKLKLDYAIGATISFDITINGITHNYVNAPILQYIENNYSTYLWVDVPELNNTGNFEYTQGGSNNSITSLNITDITVAEYAAPAGGFGLSHNFGFNLNNEPLVHPIIETTGKTVKILGSKISSLGNNHCVVVYGQGTPEQNGKELKAALTKAAALRSSNNDNMPVTVLVSPGDYMSTTGFEFPPGLNVRSLDEVTYDEVWGTLYTGVFIYHTSKDNTNPSQIGILNKGANMYGIWSNLIKFESIYSEVWIDSCATNTSVNGSFSTDQWSNLSGIFKNCTAGGDSWVAGSLSGTFTNCLTAGFGSGSFKSLQWDLQGTFTNCRSLDNLSFNAAAQLVGNFINCQGGSESFKAAGDIGYNAPTTFKDCTAGSDSFKGATLNGTFENCAAGDNSFKATAYNLNGVFKNCTAGGFSFVANNDIWNTTFKDCVAGDYSFTANQGVYATAINCTAGANSFVANGGAGANGAAGNLIGTFENCNVGSGCFTGYNINGMFKDCTASDYSFNGNNSQSGTFKNCVAGNSSFANNSVLGTNAAYVNCTAGNSSFGYGSGYGGCTNATFINCTAGDYSFGSGSTLGVSDSILDHCTAGVESFGSYYDGTNTLTANTTNTKFRYCIGGFTSADTAAEVKFCSNTSAGGWVAPPPSTGANYAFWN